MHHGISITSSASFLMVSSPSSQMTISFPSRAFTSCRFETTFSYTGVCVAMATTGMFSSMSAIGPCFISPAG